MMNDRIMIQKKTLLLFLYLIFSGFLFMNFVLRITIVQNAESILAEEYRNAALLQEEEKMLLPDYRNLLARISALAGYNHGINRLILEWASLTVLFLIACYFTARKKKAA